MPPDRWKIVPGYYLIYKFLNSLFLGLNVGTIFTIYSPLDPSVYSLGGIALALAMLLVAQLYHTIMTLGWFYRISLFVELTVMGLIVWFLLFPYTYFTALLVYAGYQLTFSFGSYLVRAETLALENDELLRRVDSAKQLGYLAGMGLSWIIYKTLEYFDIADNRL